MDNFEIYLRGHIIVIPIVLSSNLAEFWSLMVKHFDIFLGIVALSRRYGLHTDGLFKSSCNFEVINLQSYISCLIGQKGKEKKLGFYNLFEGMIKDDYQDQLLHIQS